MQCVQCGEEMEIYGEIKESSDVINLKKITIIESGGHGGGGSSKPFTKYIYQCLNPSCPNFNLLQGEYENKE